MGRAELHLPCSTLVLWLLDELKSEVQRGAVSIKYWENPFLKKGVFPSARNTVVGLTAFH